MTKKWVLLGVLVISIAGMLFSGYLSYLELFASGCQFFPISCGENSPSFFSLPACVYGFVMYMTLVVLSAIGFVSKK